MPAAKAAPSTADAGRGEIVDGIARSMMSEARSHELAPDEPRPRPPARPPVLDDAARVNREEAMRRHDRGASQRAEAKAAARVQHEARQRAEEQAAKEEAERESREREEAERRAKIQHDRHPAAAAARKAAPRPARKKAKAVARRNKLTEIPPSVYAIVVKAWDELQMTSEPNDAQWIPEISAAFRRARRLWRLSNPDDPEPEWYRLAPRYIGTALLGRTRVKNSRVRKEMQFKVLSHLNDAAVKLWLSLEPVVRRARPDWQQFRDTFATAMIPESALFPAESQRHWIDATMDNIYRLYHVCNYDAKATDNWNAFCRDVLEPYMDVNAEEQQDLELVEREAEAAAREENSE